jgi:hypothetical protein
MITIADYLYEAERRKDERAQAEQYRLSLQVPKRNSSLMQMFRPLLVRLGELLITWGSQLRARRGFSRPAGFVSSHPRSHR